MHDFSLCESDNVGEGSSIGAFTHISKNTSVGLNCKFFDHVYIDENVYIGDNVVIKCGVHLWSGTKVEDSVTIGANACILSGLTLSKGASIEAGSVVTRTVPPFAIVAGNPAGIIGYTGTHRWESTQNVSDKNEIKEHTKVSGVKIHRLNKISDLRGSLTVAEVEKQIPFSISRYFVVFDVPTKEIRGEHSHKKCHQFLVCLHGTMSLVVDDGQNREEILLDDPTLGVHIPPNVWGIQYKFSRDGVLLVLASDPYDPSDYIRDYSEFLNHLKTNKISQSEAS